MPIGGTQHDDGSFCLHGNRSKAELVQIQLVSARPQPADYDSEQPLRNAGAPSFALRFIDTLPAQLYTRRLLLQGRPLHLSSPHSLVSVQAFPPFHPDPFLLHDPPQPSQTQPLFVQRRRACSAGFPTILRAYSFSC
jgi:hypothetical protein